MGLLKAFFNNTRKPEGWLGRCMVGSMNRAHAVLADWGLSHLPETGPTEIGELGCGGGRNIRALLRKYPAATVTALDHSEISVEKARRVNREGLQTGRCRIIQGDVSCLPFEDGAFDLVTAFETVYFWPGPTESFREVYRTLRPGGAFLIVNESDGEDPHAGKWLSVIDGMRIFDGDQLARFLTEAGFSEIIVNRNTKKHWLCVLAMRENSSLLEADKRLGHRSRKRRQTDAGRMFVRTGEMGTSDAWRASLPVLPAGEETPSATSAGASAL